MKLVFLPLILLSLVLAGCGSSRGVQTDVGALNEGAVLRIGVKADTAPFGYLLGGDRVGFDIDLAQMIANELGAEAEFVTVTSQTRIPMLQAGEVDMVMASMTITRSRERQVDFSLPYFQDGQALLVKEGSVIAGYRSLSGRKVGATAGSTSAENMGRVAPGATLRLYDDFKALTKALKDGEVDAITSDRIILATIARKSKTPLVLAGGAFSTEPYGVAVRQGDAALRDAVNEALQNIWDTGTYNVIYSTWFGVGTPYANIPPFVMTPYPQ